MFKAENEVASENRKMFLYLFGGLIGALVLCLLCNAELHRHNLENPQIVCYDGVEYLFFTDGVTPHYNVDGSIKQCRK